MGKKKDKFIYRDLIKFKDKINYTSMYNTLEEDKTGRKERFQKQREDFGFDEREIWNLNNTTIMWLYAHLKRFVAWNCCDLYDKDRTNMYLVKRILKDEDGFYMYDKIDFVRNDDTENESYTMVKFKKEEVRLSIGEIIDLILEYFEYYLNDRNKDGYGIYTDIGEYGMRLYGEILGCLWT